VKKRQGEESLLDCFDCCSRTYSRAGKFALKKPQNRLCWELALIAVHLLIKRNLKV